MKLSTQIYLLLLLFLIHNIIHSMDQDFLDELHQHATEIQIAVKPKNNDQKILIEKVREAGNAIIATASLTRPIQKNIIFFRSRTCPRIFEQLSVDENGIILDTFIDTLDDKPTKAVHSLLLLCKSLNTFILNRRNTLRLTKEVSFINKCSDEIAIKTIQTKTAHKSLMIQKGFEQMCGRTQNATISKQDARAIKTSGTDINFTYGIFSENQLVKACQPFPVQKPLIVRWLLENKADTTVRTNDNDPIVLYLLNSHSNLSNEILAYFFASPSFDINHYYKTSRCNVTVTATIFYLFFIFMLKEETWYENNNLNDEQKFKLKRLQILLDNGADPELSGSMGVTPMILAKGLGNPALIDILEKAIARKAKTKRTMRKIHQAVKNGTMSLEQAAQTIYKRSF